VTVGRGRTRCKQQEEEKDGSGYSMTLRKRERMENERGSTRSQSGEIALEEVMDCDNTSCGMNE